MSSNKQKRTYKVLADTRMVITALRIEEDFEPIECEGMKLNSAVDWLGAGSIITLEKTPIDKEKWSKYIRRKLGGDVVGRT